MRLDNGNRRRTYIGIDGGGTKTTCMIADGEGRILATASGSSTNLKSNPHEHVRDELERLIRLVIRDSESSLEDVCGIYLGLAGTDRDEDKQKITGYLREWIPDDILIRVNNDAVTALAAGTWGEPGVVLIAGTGSIAYGSDPSSGYFSRVGGWGYVLGDEGSGYHIGLQALNAVMRNYDGRGEPTELTARVLKHFALEQPGQLVPRIYENGPYRQKIAELSRMVVEASQLGDAVAQRIVSEAVCSLYEIAVTAGEGIAAADHTIPLVLSGGLFSSAYFETQFRSYAQLQSSRFALQRLELPPVAGAIILSMTDSGITMTEALKDTMTKEWRQRTMAVEITTRE